MSRLGKFCLLLLLLLTFAPSLFAWAAPVVVNDWTLKTAAGPIGVKRVGYDLGLGGPVQDVRMRVYFGALGSTSPAAVVGSVIALALCLAVYRFRKMDRSERCF